MPHPTVRDFLHARQTRIRGALHDARLDAFLTCHLPNCRYVSLFTGGTAMALLTPDSFWLLVDARYTTQAGDETRGVQVHACEASLEEEAAGLLQRLRCSRVGYEARRTTTHSLDLIHAGAPLRTEWVAADGLLDRLRTIKDEHELAILRRAAKLTWQSCDDIIRLLVPGVSERDVAAELQYQLIRKGAVKTSFETIVASGRRSALPHGTATDKKLRKNEFVVVDFGIVLDGYCSDMTRTFYLGSPGAREKRVYNAVREALEQTEASLRAGVTAAEADAVARRVLGRRRLAGRFTHSTGHGLGLEVHEPPTLHGRNKTPLQAGHVVTVEPGAYIPGWGGVRIEDMVVLGARNCEVLTPYTRELVCL